jgi:hypothetical protein
LDENALTPTVAHLVAIGGEPLSIIARRLDENTLTSTVAHLIVVGSEILSGILCCLHKNALTTTAIAASLGIVNLAVVDAELLSRCAKSLDENALTRTVAHSVVAGVELLLTGGARSLNENTLTSTVTHLVAVGGEILLGTLCRLNENALTASTIAVNFGAVNLTVFDAELLLGCARSLDENALTVTVTHCVISGSELLSAGAARSLDENTLTSTVTHLGAVGSEILSRPLCHLHENALTTYAVAANVGLVDRAVANGDFLPRCAGSLDKNALTIATANGIATGSYLLLSVLCCLNENALATTVTNRIVVEG